MVSNSFLFLGLVFLFSTMAHGQPPQTSIGKAAELSSSMEELLKPCAALLQKQKECHGEQCKPVQTSAMGCVVSQVDSLRMIAEASSREVRTSLDPKLKELVKSLETASYLQQAMITAAWQKKHAISLEKYPMLIQYDNAVAALSEYHAYLKTQDPSLCLDTGLPWLQSQNCVKVCRPIYENGKEQSYSCLSEAEWSARFPDATPGFGRNNQNDDGVFGVCRVQQPAKPVWNWEVLKKRYGIEQDAGLKEQIRVALSDKSSNGLEGLYQLVTLFRLQDTYSRNSGERIAASQMPASCGRFRALFARPWSEQETISLLNRKKELKSAEYTKEVWDAANSVRNALLKWPNATKDEKKELEEEVLFALLEYPILIGDYVPNRGLFSQGLTLMDALAREATGNSASSRTFPLVDIYMSKGHAVEWAELREKTSRLVQKQLLAEMANVCQVGSTENPLSFFARNEDVTEELLGFVPNHKQLVSCITAEYQKRAETEKTSRFFAEMALVNPMGATFGFGMGAWFGNEVQQKIDHCGKAGVVCSDEQRAEWQNLLKETQRNNMFLALGAVAPWAHGSLFGLRRGVTAFSSRIQVAERALEVMKTKLGQDAVKEIQVVTGTAVRAQRRWWHVSRSINSVGQAGTTPWRILRLRIPPQTTRQRYIELLDEFGNMATHTRVEDAHVTHLVLDGAHIGGGSMSIPFNLVSEINFASQVARRNGTHVVWYIHEYDQIIKPMWKFLMKRLQENPMLHIVLL